MAKTVLALDASTEQLSVALRSGEQTWHESSDAPRQHAQQALPMIDSVVKKAGLEHRHLDLIAVTTGPGAFTGIRIGLSVAQGLAYGLGLPLLPCDSLRALAASYHRDNPDDTRVLISCLDARMGEVYWAAHRFSASGIEVLHDSDIAKPEDFIEQLLGEFNAESVVGLGHGWALKSESVQRFIEDGMREKGSRFSPMLLPSALGVLVDGVLALDSASIERADPMAIQPRYLRNEITWQKRQRRRLEREKS